MSEYPIAGCAYVSPDPEVVRFKRIDDTKRKLRELFERWDDRLFIEEVSIAEKYLEGRVSEGSGGLVEPSPREPGEGCRGTVWVSQEPRL